MSTPESEQTNLPTPAPETEKTENVVDPPVAPQEDNELQEEDFQNMEEIERELAKTMEMNDEFDDEDDFEEEGDFTGGVSKSQSADFLPSGAVPTINGKLSTHAAEFWFPGSRECKCCKGFKYGCDCCVKNGFMSCQEAGCVEAAEVGKKRPTEAPTMQRNFSRGNSTGEGSPQKSLPSPINASGVVFCKFEFSPGGCRFGASCRFIHQSASGGISRNGSLESPKGDGRAFCPYFMKGNCDFGDKCRYAHI